MFRRVAHFATKRYWFGDVVLLTLFLLFLYFFIGFAKEWTSAFHQEVEIDLSLSSLPKYSMYSLIRAFVAYGLSLVFTLVYGYVAAKKESAARIMLPLLDIGQSIPVLGFMPGLVLGLIALFPRNNFGMEIACIILIFTGQVWNMTFSFYASIRAVPLYYYEMADVVGFNWWRKFKRLELPYSAINLAWNSLMSMAGGWFFLVTCESFTLGDKNFRIAGLGSYMALAIEKNDSKAMWLAIVAMCSVIVFTDFVVWRPIIAWTNKFRVEDSQDDSVDVPFLTLLLRDSWFARFMAKLTLFLREKVRAQRRKHMLPAKMAAKVKMKPLPPRRFIPKFKVKSEDVDHFLAALIPKFFLFLFMALLVWAGLQVWELVRALGRQEWSIVMVSTLYTFGRVFISLILSSIWAIPCGVLVGLSPKLTRIFQPFIQIAASFPAPMLYPLAIGIFMMMHITLTWSSIFLMLLGVQWYILFNVLAGATSISRDIRESFALTGVSEKAKWTKLYLPSVFPTLVTGWITAAGGAWNASIVAEYVAYKGDTLKAPGLGELISEATASGNFPLLTACLIVMVVTVVGINRSVWRPLQRYAEVKFRFER